LEKEKNIVTSSMVLGTARDVGLDVHFRSFGVPTGPKWHPSQVLGTKVHFTQSVQN